MKFLKFKPRFSQRIQHRTPASVLNSTKNMRGPKLDPCGIPVYRGRTCDHQRHKLGYISMMGTILVISLEHQTALASFLIGLCDR